MLFFTREKLMAHLSEVPALGRAYAARDPSYVDAAVAWMASVEETLLRVRHPLSSLVSTQKARIQSVEDGYRPPEMPQDKGSVRQARRLVTALAVAQVEEVLRQVVASADARFNDLRDRLAQLLAVASAIQPIPLSEGLAREDWARRVWADLPITGETRGMHGYLSGAFQPTDLHQVLAEVLENLAVNARRSQPAPLPSEAARRRHG